MIVNEETWRKSWGNLNWKKVTPSQIDELIEKGYDVNMIWRANYPLGYEHSNPLIESMKANCLPKSEGYWTDKYLLKTSRLIHWTTLFYVFCCQRIIF